LWCNRWCCIVCIIIITIDVISVGDSLALTIFVLSPSFVFGSPSEGATFFQAYFSDFCQFNQLPLLSFVDSAFIASISACRAAISLVSLFAKLGDHVPASTANF
jgi:hypothetical protein